MIYLSAQPDECYFLWQLQLQMYNFHKIGVLAKQIHILVGYNPKYGLSAPFVEFINSHKNNAFIFTYEDTRESKEYASSIRPHIIAKHLRKYPYLANEIIFYHDSDVLLREQIGLRLPSSRNVWYASNTNSYTGIDRILSCVSTDIFEAMCSIIGVELSIVLERERKGGGAQYLLTGVDWKFWRKIECDCEKMYIFLRDISNDPKNGSIGTMGNSTIDYWLTDIWVTRWNALLIGYEVIVHQELDFCWISSHINEWYNTKILHYTGINDVFSEKFFIKSKYKIYPPFYDDFSKISQDTCSKIVVNWISAYNSEKYYPIFPHSAVVIEFNKENTLFINLIISYLKKYGVTVLLISGDTKITYPDNVIIIQSWQYLSSYIQNQNIISNYIFFPTSCIIPICCMKNILGSSIDVASKGFVLCGSGYKIDLLTKCIFERTLDDGYLLENKGKFKSVEMKSVNLDKMQVFQSPLFTIDISDNLFYL